MISRRGLVSGLAALVAAPAIVKAASLMPVRTLPADPLDVLLHEMDWVAHNSAVIRVTWRMVKATDLVRATEAEIAAIAQPA